MSKKKTCKLFVNTQTHTYAHTHTRTHTLMLNDNKRSVHFITHPHDTMSAWNQITIGISASTANMEPPQHIHVSSGKHFSCRRGGTVTSTLLDFMCWCVMMVARHAMHVWHCLLAVSPLPNPVHLALGHAASSSAAAAQGLEAGKNLSGLEGSALGDWESLEGAGHRERRHLRLLGGQQGNVVASQPVSSTDGNNHADQSSPCADDGQSRRDLTGAKSERLICRNTSSQHVQTVVCGLPLVWVSKELEERERLHNQGSTIDAEISQAYCTRGEHAGCMCNERKNVIMVKTARNSTLFMSRAILILPFRPLTCFDRLSSAEDRHDAQTTFRPSVSVRGHCREHATQSNCCLCLCAEHSNADACRSAICYFISDAAIADFAHEQASNIIPDKFSRPSSRDALVHECWFPRQNFWRKRWHDVSRSPHLCDSARHDFRWTRSNRLSLFDDECQRVSKKKWFKNGPMDLTLILTAHQPVTFTFIYCCPWWRYFFSKKTRESAERWKKLL